MITSTANEKIKLIRKLKERKFRSESGLFFAEGTKIILDALNTGAEIQQLIIAPELIRTDGAKKILQMGTESQMDVLEVIPSVFQTLAAKENPQGIAGVLRQEWSSAEEVLQDFSGLWLALYEVADPGNLGTIMRTMDAVGGKGIFLVDNCTDPFDPVSIRASMGALFSLKLCRVTLQEFSSIIKKNLLYTLGTSDEAKTDFHNENYRKDMILCMGSEREGLPSKIINVCSGMVSIPMLGISDSLNLAVATGIVLYEILDQIRSKNT